MKISIQ